MYKEKFSNVIDSYASPANICCRVQVIFVGPPRRYFLRLRVNIIRSGPLGWFYVASTRRAGKSSSRGNAVRPCENQEPRCRYRRRRRRRDPNSQGESRNAISPERDVRERGMPRISQRTEERRPAAVTAAAVETAVGSLE